MASVTVKAIVLRHADYKDYDRMLTLFSPTLGRVEAAARGCRRPNAKTLSCTELFACGDYVLYAKGDRYTVTSFSLQEAFYPLRLDVDRLSHGVYLLNLCETVVQPGVGESALFLPLLKSLAALAYGDTDARAVTAAFTVTFMGLLGFTPRLDNCILCGEEADGGFFAMDLGGLLCPRCMARNAQGGAGYAWQTPRTGLAQRQPGAARHTAASGQPVPLDRDALAFLRAAQSEDLETLLTHADAVFTAETARAALGVMLCFVEAHLEKQVKSAKFLM